MLQSEIERLRDDCVGVILLGDINIHHTRWLRFSNRNTELGERLWEVCRDLGLKQIVAKPTRGEYLLDLILTDSPSLCKVDVLPEISDHRVVCLDIQVTVSYAEPVSRAVWDMKEANWDGLRRDISMRNWKYFFQRQGSRRFGAAFLRCFDWILQQTYSSKEDLHQSNLTPMAR